jgi:hypothetical protein
MFATHFYNFKHTCIESKQQKNSFGKQNVMFCFLKQNKKA